MRLSPGTLQPLRDYTVIELHERLTTADIPLRGENWNTKATFHVSLLTGPQRQDVLRETGLGDAALDGLIRQAADGLTWTVRLFHDFRIIRRDERRTIIAFCGVEAADAFFERLSSLTDTRIVAPPLHVTLWTGPDGRGIGLSSTAEVERDGIPLTEEESGDISDALARNILPV